MSTFQKRTLILTLVLAAVSVPLLAGCPDNKSPTAPAASGSAASSASGSAKSGSGW